MNTATGVQHITELTETNNVGIQSIEVVPPSNPDLAIGALSLSAAGGSLGGEVAVEATIENIGVGGEGQVFAAGIYLSDDAEVSTADLLLGECSGLSVPSASQRVVCQQAVGGPRRESAGSA